MLDLSLGMLRKAQQRNALVTAADLARPPLRNGSCALVVAFTSLLGDLPRSSRALAALVQPGGTLAVSFLAHEAPEGLAQLTGLRHTAGPIPAGQDLLFVLRKD